MGASREAGRMAAVRIWATRETDRPISSANSSSVGSRPKISCNFKAVRRMRDILSTRCTGRRMVLD